jgi:hypothetical protein
MSRLVTQRWEVGVTFTLGEAYEFVTELSSVYPENRHLKDSVRVGLQKLRQDGLVEMLEPGVYRRVR